MPSGVRASQVCPSCVRGCSDHVKKQLKSDQKATKTEHKNVGLYAQKTAQSAYWKILKNATNALYCDFSLAYWTGFPYCKISLVYWYTLSLAYCRGLPYCDFSLAYCDDFSRQIRHVRRIWRLRVHISGCVKSFLSRFRLNPKSLPYFTHISPIFLPYFTHISPIFLPYSHKK